MNAKRLLIGCTILSVLLMYASFLISKIILSREREPDERKITYIVPKRSPKTETPELVAPPPVVNPIPSTQADLYEPEPLTVESEIDPELDEFMALVAKVAELEYDDSEPEETDVLKYSPEQMLKHLSYHTTREQHDFIVSEDFTVWSRYAFNIPEITPPDASACRESNPGDSFGFSRCMEEGFRIAIGSHGKELEQGLALLQDFLSQLDPVVFSYSESDVYASVIPADESDEAHYSQ